MRTDAPAAGLDGSGLDRATALSRAFAHAAESLAARVELGWVAAVVAYLKLERGPGHGHRDDGCGRPRVLDDVAQRLLHDPVGGSLDERRQVTGVVLVAQLHAQVILLKVVYELAQVIQPGRGVKPGVWLTDPDLPDRFPGIAQRARGNLIDLAQRLRSAWPVAVEQPPAGARLQGNARQRMAHHVVHVP